MRRVIEVKSQSVFDKIKDVCETIGNISMYFGPLLFMLLLMLGYILGIRGPPKVTKKRVNEICLFEELDLHENPEGRGECVGWLVLEF